MRPSATLASLLLFGGSLSLAAIAPWQDAYAAKPDQPASEAVPRSEPDKLALAGTTRPIGLPDSLPALEQERATLQERLAQIGLTIDHILTGVVMAARKADPWGPARENDPAPVLEALGQERQLILDRLGQIDRKTLLLAATPGPAPGRPAPQDPDADLLAGLDSSPGLEDTETTEALMARVERFDAAMDRLLASIEAPPDSLERGGASGEELLKRLYALRDAQARLLERIARIEPPSIPLPPPSPPEEQVASAPAVDSPAPVSPTGNDMVEATSPVREAEAPPPVPATPEPPAVAEAPMAETRLVEAPAVETPVMQAPAAEAPVAAPPVQAPVTPQVLALGAAVPPPPPPQAPPPAASPLAALAMAPSVPAAQPVRDSGAAVREAKLTPALRCRALLQRAQLGEELTPTERKDLRGACVT